MVYSILDIGIARYRFHPIIYRITDVETENIDLQLELIVTLIQVNSPIFRSNKK